MPCLTNFGIRSVSGLFMSSESRFALYEQASVWAEQLRTDPSFTISDAEELKGHLLDIAEDLISNGLREEEAFVVATSRLGEPTDLKDEFEEINAPIIQMRKAILVLSGILAFSFFYYFLFASIDLLVRVLDYFNDDYVLNFRVVVFYTLAYCIFIVSSTFSLYSFDDRKIKLFENMDIRPGHLFLILLCNVLLVLIDQRVSHLLNIEFNPGSYTTTHLYTLFDYLNYIFPFILIICFIVLYRKFDQTVVRFGESFNSNTEIHTNSDNTPIQYSIDFISEEETIIQWKVQLEVLESIGLSKQEALLVLKLRNRDNVLKFNNNNLLCNPKRFNYNLLMIFSSVLVYFFLHFLLNSSSMILFSVLQYFQNDPALNIRRTFSFNMFFQWAFVLFTATLYFHDKRIIQLIKQHHIKPVHTLLLLLGTIFLALLDRLFLPISKSCLGNSMALKYELMNIIYVSDFTFPFILCTCLLVLFNKYYRDNIRISRWRYKEKYLPI